MTLDEYNELKARCEAFDIPLEFEEFEFTECRNAYTKNIDTYRLDKWVSKEKSCKIPSFINSINPYAFKSCDWLESIDFSESGILDIPNELLLEHQNVTKIILPPFVRIIGDRAFEYTSIKSITIPDSVRTIGVSAFKDCVSLSNVNFGEKSELNLIRNNAFSHSGIKNLIAPDSLERIHSKAFANCDSLRNVHLGRKLSHLSHETFSYCNNLVYFEIDDSAPISAIAEHTFVGCTNLETVKCNTRLSTLNEYAFSCCYNLKEITGSSLMNKIHYTALLDTKVNI
jgi:hypothetical protein